MNAGGGGLEDRRRPRLAGSLKPGHPAGISPPPSPPPAPFAAPPATTPAASSGHARGPWPAAAAPIF